MNCFESVEASVFVRVQNMPQDESILHDEG